MGVNLGSTSTAMRTAPGRNSCKSPSCFAPSSVDMKLTPVTLLPGLLRLATRPSLTGSPSVAKTIGIVVFAALAAIAEGYRSQLLLPPDGVSVRLRGQAVDRIGPAPSDTRSPHSGPRRSRFR
jgi:hypothetical protein